MLKIRRNFVEFEEFVKNKIFTFFETRFFFIFLLSKTNNNNHNNNNNNKPDMDLVEVTKDNIQILNEVTTITNRIKNIEYTIHAHKDKNSRDYRCKLEELVTLQNIRLDVQTAYISCLVRNNTENCEVLNDELNNLSNRLDALQIQMDSQGSLGEADKHLLVLKSILDGLM